MVKNSTHIKFTLTTILFFLSLTVYAEELRNIYNLSGKWKFSVGDSKSWASPDFNDSNWDYIQVPKYWEQQGLKGYNGFAWYRKTFWLGHVPQGQILYLRLGRIDDCDEVYVNGKLVGKTGTMPPNYVTGYDQKRKYIIPDGLLNENGENTIAVRVFDSHHNGGMIGSTFGIYADYSYNYIDFQIGNIWKYRHGNDFTWKDYDYNDTDWDEIVVPSYWENYEQTDYDGYVWYRKSFVFEYNWYDEEESYYIILGKIDDVDKVYFNGKMIGEVYDLDDDPAFDNKHRYINNRFEYDVKRAYKIPGDLIKPGQKNVLAVQVYDKVRYGGIYEGPIGIAKKDNYEHYLRRNTSSYKTIWDILEDIFY